MFFSFVSQLPGDLLPTAIVNLAAVAVLPDHHALAPATPARPFVHARPAMGNNKYLVFIIHFVSVVVIPRASGLGAFP